MRISWKALGAVWAVVLAHGLCAGAVSVSTGADLVAKIKGGETALELAPGTYTVTEPIRVTGNVTIKGVPTTTDSLPTSIIITDAIPLDPVCPGNVFNNGSFDASLVSWAALGTPPPTGTVGAARFEVPAGTAAGTAARLSQSVNVPASPGDLTFTLGVPVGTDAADKFECLIQSVGLPGQTLKTMDGAAGAATQNVSIPVPAAYKGRRCTFIFRATFNSGTGAAFELDSVCLASLNPALITVTGTGQLTMEKIQITVGSIGGGVTVEGPGGSLAMRRCFVTGAAQAGVYFDGSSSGTIISSVFDQNGGTGAMCNSSGSVVLFQSTFRGNGTGLSGTGTSVQLVACLLDSAPTGIAIKQYLNYIIGASGGGETGFLNLDAATLGTPVFQDTIWRGKLDPLAIKIRAALSFGALPAALTAVLRPLNWTEDFEGLARYATGPLGVGASEQRQGVSITEWGYTVDHPVIGSGQTATITVWTNAADLTGMELGLRMVPELPPVGFTGPTPPYIVVPLPTIGVDSSIPPRATASGPISFSGPFNPAWAEDSSGVLSTVTACTDGAPSFILTQLGNPVDIGPSSRPEFIIDTVAPKLDLAVDPPTMVINKPLVPVLEGPTGWQPLLAGMAIPRSQDSLADREMHWFIRGINDTNPTVPMALTVHGHFVERRPVDLNANEYAVTVSGFDPAAMAALGITPAPATGNPADISLDWTFPVAGTQLTHKPDAQDRGANWAVVYSSVIGGHKRLDHNMHAWYMAPPPIAGFDASSTPQGQQTLSPRFGWTVAPSPGLSKAEEFPCSSAVAFKIFASTATSATPVALSTWIWVMENPIQKTTVVNQTTGATLNDLLAAGRAAAAQSRQMYIGIRGGDEAGNVQPDDATVLYRTWIDGAGQENVAVETDLNVQLSHWWPVNGQSVELRPFGSVGRVPLPSPEQAKAGAYVRATALISARFPTSATAVLIDWKLYEDGALVAQGRAFPDPATGQAPPFALPEGLLNPANYGIALGLPPDPTAFLRVGPDKVQNRMGDEMSPDGAGRKREVHYMLVAQTEATVSTGGTDFYGNPVVQNTTVTDPTPASVEFSIYVPEMDKKVREEQPVRIYERE